MNLLKLSHLGKTSRVYPNKFVKYSLMSRLTVLRNQAESSEDPTSLAKTNEILDTLDLKPTSLYELGWTSNKNFDFLTEEITKQIKSLSLNADPDEQQKLLSRKSSYNYLTFIFKELNNGSKKKINLPKIPSELTLEDLEIILKAIEQLNGHVGRISKTLGQLKVGLDNKVKSVKKSKDSSKKGSNVKQNVIQDVTPLAMTDIISLVRKSFEPDIIESKVLYERVSKITEKAKTDNSQLSLSQLINHLVTSHKDYNYDDPITTYFK
jgi:hypothetical protein